MEKKSIRIFLERLFSV